MGTFAELGIKLDNFLVDVQTWNIQRIWYKPYAYFKIVKYINNREFRDEEHFYKVLDYSVGKTNKDINWITGKQYKRFEHKYQQSIKKRKC